MDGTCLLDVLDQVLRYPPRVEGVGSVRGDRLQRVGQSLVPHSVADLKQVPVLVREQLPVAQNDRRRQSGAGRRRIYTNLWVAL